MKKLKYVKLFESFLNEELSPETLQSFKQKAGAEAAKGDLDSVRRQKQARSAASHVSPLVKNAINELRELMKEAVVRLKIYNWNEDNKTSFDIWLHDDYGLNKVDANVEITIRVNNTKYCKKGSSTLQRLKITKDSYDMVFKIQSDFEQEGGDAWKLEQLWKDLVSDRKIVDKIKALVTLVQENEIAKEKEEPKKKNWLGF